MMVDQHGPVDVLNHTQLLDQGERAAVALAKLGVRPGDRVAVLLPMSLESVVVTLACIRLEALRLTLPVGDHLGFIRHRIRTSGARVVITAGSCSVDGTVRDVKSGLDRALWACPDVHSVLVVQQLARPVPWTPGRDVWWHEALDAGPVPGGPYAGVMSSTPEQPATPSSSRPVPTSAPASLIFDDPLERRSADDTDQGWGDRPAEDGTPGDLIRFLNEKPPHHL
ncbi:AMP-binding protein [Streptomyces xiamenensis]|uniref:AMP-binding protein n=1 Tax=Streptomyces xiamenensis TaxID=408015 RepID=UPI0037D64A69